MAVIKAPYFLSISESMVLPKEALVGEEHIESLVGGDYVKVALRNKTGNTPTEKFWAELLNREGTVFRVRVHNNLELTHLHGVKNGDILYIQKEHILAMLKD